MSKLLINKEFVQTLAKNDQFVRDYSLDHNKTYPAGKKRLERASLAMLADESFAKYLLNYGFNNKEIY